MTRTKQETPFWLGFQRGAARRVAKWMKRARAVKAAPAKHWPPDDKTVQIRLYVHYARQANRDWRRFAARVREEREVQALEAQGKYREAITLIESRGTK